MHLRAALLSALALSACAPAVGWDPASTETDLDFVEPTPPPPIEDVPDGVNEILTSEDLARLAQAGMAVHVGDSPPWIEGEYLMDSLTITYDDIGSAIGTDLIETFVGFAQQDADAGTIDSSLHDDVSDGSGIGGFVSGTGACFTVWQDFHGSNHPDSCEYRMAQLFSGCIHDDGIEHLQFGYILVERTGPCEETVPLRHRRVMDEDDGLAERISAS